MNTQINSLKILKHGFKNSLLLMIPCLLAFLSSPVYAADDYQQKVLFSPSSSMLQAEAKGRVMIYDRLKSETIEQAMTQQFDRIENMMFVNTLYKRENGNHEVEEEDCD